MLAAIEEPVQDHQAKRSPVKFMHSFGNRGLDRLFTTNSKMFRLHGLNQLLEIVISNHPSKGTEDEFFKEGERLAKGLVMVNDMVERGMALIQDFNTRIEKD